MGFLGGLIGRLGLVGFIGRRGGETGSAGIEKEISVFIQPPCSVYVDHENVSLLLNERAILGILSDFNSYS